MFESSKDILNLVAAISIASLAFFLCWALYYIITSARSSVRVIRKVEQGVDKAESLIDLVKEKLSSSASYLMILSNLVKKGIEIFENRKSYSDNSQSEDEDVVVGDIKKSKSRRRS